jgi:hypothetical protein
VPLLGPLSSEARSQRASWKSLKRPLDRRPSLAWAQNVLAVGRPSLLAERWKPLICQRRWPSQRFKVIGEGAIFLRSPSRHHLRPWGRSQRKVPREDTPYHAPREELAPVRADFTRRVPPDMAFGIKLPYIAQNDGQPTAVPPAPARGTAGCREPWLTLQNKRQAWLGFGSELL